MKGNSCFSRLILAAALLLSLTACAAQDTPAETDTAPLQEEPPASALQTLRADLDGDGTEDMVEYQVLESNGSFPPRWRLRSTASPWRIPWSSRGSA